MKKEIVISNETVTVRGFNHHTLIRLNKGEPVNCLWRDQEENVWKRTEVTWRGGDTVTCIDSEMEWESSIEELKTECRPLADQAYPGDSD